jgi:signal transduction histidine kinase
VAAVGFWWMRRRHQAAINARATLPGYDNNLREARLHVLEDLELSGHGAIAPLRSLRRLIWLLDALNTGIGYSSEFDQRLREIWMDCHRENLPRLLVILDRARAAQLAPASIATASSALESAQTLLAGFHKSRFKPEVILEARTALSQHCKEAEDALQKLRKEVVGLFTCDLQEVVAKVLRANEETLREAEVEVSTGMIAAGAGEGSTSAASDGAPGVECRIDPTELGFILDNLVGNAVRAMAGVPTRKLEIFWVATSGLVKLEVSDTGIGISDEDRDLVFEASYSTRDGGGLGLSRSVRLLRKYEGSLKIKSSAPGKGTTFEVLLPRAGGSVS